MPEIARALRPVARLLPPEEWPTRTPVFGTLDPQHSFVVVVEDGGPGEPILAQWAALTVVHVEGLEVAPEAQGHAGVGRALLTAMVNALTGMKIAEVLTQAERPEVAQMIASAGGHPLPGETWVIPIGPGPAAVPGLTLVEG